MKYARVVARGVRLTVRNPFAAVLVSVATTVALLPLLSGLLLAGPLGALVGLWTSSVLLGFVAAGGASIATTVTERELSLGTGYFWKGVREATLMGPAVGVGTFFAALIASTLVFLPVEGLLGMSLALTGVYVLLAWFVVVMFALTIWVSLGDPRAVREPFIEGGKLVLEHPIAVIWILVQAIGWTLLSIPLVIAPVIVLPGLVQIIVTGIVLATVDHASVDDPEVGADDG